MIWDQMRDQHARNRVYLLGVREGIVVVDGKRAQSLIYAFEPRDDAPGVAAYFRNGRRIAEPRQDVSCLFECGILEHERQPCIETSHAAGEPRKYHRPERWLDLEYRISLRPQPPRGLARVTTRRIGKSGIDIHTGIREIAHAVQGILGLPRSEHAVDGDAPHLRMREPADLGTFREQRFQIEHVGDDRAAYRLTLRLAEPDGARLPDVHRPR